MWKQMLVIGLILSVVFVSGCVQTGQTTVSTEAENQAADQIEQEMEQAIEDLDLDEIENLLLT
jgi:outer membrane murein-binding lipoprotein Lpp